MTRWRELAPGRWVQVPPECCPACGWGWAQDGPGRPGEGFTACSCHGIGTQHTRWTCRVCGALVAEGCTDVTGWASVHTPAGLDPGLRWAVEEEPDEHG